MSLPPSPPLERVRCVPGDLTRETTDAIVNAANDSLRGGGGVDGAIHRAAGPELLQECISRHPDGCPTGEARLTGGHRLPAQYVIHTVGPVWHGGDRGEPEQLASCYRSAVALAAAEGLTSLSFPAISCGVYGYPLDAAADVALRALAAALEEHPTIRSVRLVLFGEDTLQAFERAHARLRTAPPE